jgi:hypothetical protein
MRKRLFVATALAGVLAFVSVSRPVRAAEAKKAGTDPAAQRAACDATCRQDYQGNTAAIDACIRNCGATGPASAGARSTSVKSSKSNSQDRLASPPTSPDQPVKASNLNLSKSNINREAALKGPTAPPPGTVETTTTLNASKSNSYRQTGSSTSGTVTNVDAAAKTISLKRKDGSIIVMDASKLTGGLPKIGQSVNVNYTDVAGKPMVVSIAVSDPGVPNK